MKKDRESVIRNNRIKYFVYSMYILIFITLLVFLIMLPKNKKNFEKQLYNNNNNAERNNDGVDVIEEKVKEVLYNKPKEKIKKVFLTFDDGPTSNTEKILDILKKHDVKATFFVVYQKGENKKKLYRRIVKEGHTIGVHSYSHKYKEIYKSEKAFKDDVLKMRKYIYDVTGVKTEYYRFPGGSGNEVSKIKINKCFDILKKESMIYFDWNVDSGDARSNKVSAKSIVKNVLNGVEGKNTSIVLMHDAAAKKSTSQSLSKIITSLKKKGYAFASIDKSTPRMQQKK